MPSYMARVRRTELPDGSQDIALELIPDQRTVELHQGDEFVSVDLKVDPFEGG